MVDEHVCSADGLQPDGVGQNPHQLVNGDEYRYQEEIASDSDRLSVLGTVEADTLVASRVYQPAQANVAGRQYARRAAAAGVGGVLTVDVGVLLAARYFQTPVPFL